MNKSKHSLLGEVYTHPDIIECISKDIESEQIGINLKDLKDPDEIWLEPSIGDGRMLIAIKKLLMLQGHSEKDVLARLYGVDIQPESVKQAILGLYGPGELEEITNKNSKIRKWKHPKWGIIENIICADSYNYSFNFSSHPKKIHGFDWLEE